ncbi:meiosis regulator and mRNA stability factor 1 isoform X2 [Cephus cinctus]|uniref:Meiosis regulator and mRNA stability factor 1 isoform X2 n=1 Tax=Cephus cinctus TaxID=211228 RepID=A0AAJ7FF13_CEPCN|nr:meiosis regulator and mRNA stability factor 1 isoform X2 [Cephus cinctus]
MAVRNFFVRFCAESDDEIEGLNEKLLELLSTLKSSQPVNQLEVHSTQAASATSTENDTDTQLEYRGMATPPSFRRYHYDCSFLHCGSPVNSGSLSNCLPPIGVFWDIENCQVPKGRSAVAVTQVIREKFFSGYREAEFIVVCDVYKENKQVIQELNDAQVNLIHVASSCKNAADEKLRQSIRRFADTHGSPAAIILISGDIDFAADLSDLRHRKKIHVILLHKEHTSEALILCANEHYNFMELMEPLPSRNPTKVAENFDLLVYNLPKDKDVVAIKRRLKQLSSNSGGRVIGVYSNSATVRFTSHDCAIRAQKRMDGEHVFGSEIFVRFPKNKEAYPGKIRGSSLAREYTASDSEAAAGSPRPMYSASSSIGGARSLPVTPHYHSLSPVVGGYSGWSGVHCTPVTASAGMIQPPPVCISRNCSNTNDGTFSRSYNELPRSQSPVVWPVTGPQQFARFWDEQYGNDRAKNLGKRSQASQGRDNGVSHDNRGGSRTPDGLRGIRRSHSSLSHSSDWNNPRSNYFPAPPNFSGNGYGQSHSFKRRSPSPMYSIQGRDNQWNGQNQQPGTQRRTPSPYDCTILQSMGHQTSRTSPYYQSDPENEEVEKFFNPINNRNGNNAANGSYTPIELQVTNLDQNIDPKEMKRILSSIFMEHVMVLHVSVFMQSDGNFAANVKVPSLPEAQYAISQLHRRKVGYKRILISYAHTGGPNPQLVRSHIVMLLQEVPGHKLPLFKLREMYESRFMISISVSELYKMKDVCIITEDPDGRMVSLNPDHRNTPSPCFSNNTQDGNFDFPYCIIHTQKPWSDKGWAEQEMASLPNVKISLSVLATRIHQLLISHNGSLPLPSLSNCYEAEFKESLDIDKNGVPLEHLVSCLQSIDLKQGVGSVKHIVRVGSKGNDDSHEENKCVSPPLANQLALFSRELVDLLKTAPHCQLLFNRFIPAYHHHFGRQCRVADYGFTKLIDLLEALTHTVQVMGEGDKRVVTLSHRAQVRRFTSDLLRVLKAQASKQVALSEFPSVYSRVIGKPWDVVDYGVCEIGDILSEVSENTVVVTNFNGDDKMIAIPKREQTPEEIERTKQFAIEVIELLRHAPQCRMLFNKFVPSYHHHFGHQCRVSDYGFTKLIELFEAIPNIVRIEEINGGERRIVLTEKEGLRVLGEQISKLVSRSRNGLSVTSISQAFLRQFGYALRPELFDCNSMLQLIEKLSATVKVIRTAAGPVVQSVDKSHLQELALQCRRILMDQPDHRVSVKEFERFYSQYYAHSCNLDEVEKELTGIVKFTIANGERFIQLTPLYCFACNLYQVMIRHGGSLNMSQFESAYLAVIGSAVRAAKYGFPTLSALLRALPCTVIIKDTRNKKKIMHLNKKLATVGIPLPSTFSSTSPYRDTDSSNESFESDTSSRANASNASITSEERNKWPAQSASSQNTWKQKEDTDVWEKKEETDWSNMPNTATSNKWPVLESSGECFLKSLVRAPVICKELPVPPPSPPKPDSFVAEETSKQKPWNSSVWSSPPNYVYSQHEHATNVDVPAFTLPQWNQMPGEDILSNLLSPTKNLLPAAANPLNPRTSPYFSSNRNLVVAPHPSELPLPSMSLTPKKIGLAVDNKGGTPIVKDDVSKITDTNAKPIEVPAAFQEENSTDHDANRVDSTPTKRLFSGKRRLAAQFNQPIDS